MGSSILPDLESHILLQDHSGRIILPTASPKALLSLFLLRAMYENFWGGRSEYPCERFDVPRRACKLHPVARWMRRRGQKDSSTLYQEGCISPWAYVIPCRERRYDRIYTDAFRSVPGAYGAWIQANPQLSSFISNTSVWRCLVLKDMRPFLSPSLSMQIC
jgi:hypothetical protein